MYWRVGIMFINFCKIELQVQERIKCIIVLSSLSKFHDYYQQSIHKLELYKLNVQISILGLGLG